MCVSKQTNERAVMFTGRALDGGEILPLLCVSHVTPTFESCSAGPTHTDGPCCLSLSHTHTRAHTRARAHTHARLFELEIEFNSVQYLNNPNMP